MLASQVAFDAISENEHFIPQNPFAVGGYINGAITKFIWSDAQFEKYPNSYHIRINVTGELGRGNALDVETGDATPANVQPWIESRPSATDPLLVYCNRSNLGAVSAARDAALKASGIFANLWVATLDGTIEPNSMTQFGQIRANGAAVCDISLITGQTLLTAMAAHLG